MFPALLIFPIIRWYSGAPFSLVIGYLKYSTHTEECVWECSQSVQIPGNVPRPAPGPEPFPVTACRRTTTLTLMPASELCVNGITWPVPFGIWGHLLSLTLVTFVRVGAWVTCVLFPCCIIFCRVDLPLDLSMGLCDSGQ